jgi:regulator of replication initiation timing
MSDLISAATENNRLRIENAALRAEVERLREALGEMRGDFTLIKQVAEQHAARENNARPAALDGDG